MKIAVFSDIHANRQAWWAIEADMARAEVDARVCLGDIVGYGPEPQEVLDGVRAATAEIVLGNHDAVIGGRMDSADFNDHARDIIEWTRRQLDGEAAEYFRAAPEMIEGDGVLYTHAEAAQPMRFSYIDTPEEAQESFNARPERLIFIGHTHVPCVFALDTGTGAIARRTHRRLHLREHERYLINVGSVGEPRDGDPRASYVIFDDEARTVEFRKVAFDVEGYLADLAGRGLEIEPSFLAAYRYQQAHPGEEPPADGMAAVRALPALKRPVDAPPPEPVAPASTVAPPTRRIVRFAAKSPSRATARPSAPAPSQAPAPLPVPRKKPAAAWKVWLVPLLLVAAAMAGWWWRDSRTKAMAASVVPDPAPPPAAAPAPSPEAPAPPLAQENMSPDEEEPDPPEPPAADDGLPHGDVWLVRPGQAGGANPAGAAHWNHLDAAGAPDVSKNYRLLNAAGKRPIHATLVSLKGTLSATRPGIKAAGRALFSHPIPDAVSSGCWSMGNASGSFALEINGLKPDAMYEVAVLLAGNGKSRAKTASWQVEGGPGDTVLHRAEQVRGLGRSPPVRPTSRGSLTLRFELKGDNGSTGLNAFALRERPLAAP